MNRELRATDHQLVPASRLEPREAPTDELASDQAVPPLTSAALRGMPHHTAEQDSGSRRSPLPGLGDDLPGLLSDLPGLSTSLRGLCPDLPGLNAPLSGKHVPPLQGQDGLLPRGQDGRRLEIVFSGYNAGVQPDAVAPHSTTAAHKTSPAVSPHAARSGPLDARPGGLGTTPNPA